MLNEQLTSYCSTQVLLKSGGAQNTPGILDDLGCVFVLDWTEGLFTALES